MPTNLTINQPKLTLPLGGSQAPGGVPLVFDFSVDTSFIVNLTLFQQQGNIGGVTSMWVDNSGSSGPLTIQFGQSGQIFIIKANTQGYVPVLAPNPITLTVTCLTGGGSAVQVTLLNYYIAPALWITV